VYAPPAPVDEYGNPLPPDGLAPLERAGQAIRDWLGWGDRGDPAKQAPPPPPEPAQ